MIKKKRKVVSGVNSPNWGVTCRFETAVNKMLLCQPRRQRRLLVREIRRLLLDLTAVWDVEGTVTSPILWYVCGNTKLLVSGDVVVINRDVVELGLLGCWRVYRAYRTRLAYEQRKTIEG